MGGRGASSGISKRKNGKPGNEYGTQYETLHTFGNIKYVKKRPGASEALMETKTEGRVYAEAGGDRILRIVSFSDGFRRNRVIELDKRRGEWHVHSGYEHAEFGEEQHLPLTEEDTRLLDKVLTEWHNHLADIV